MPLTINQFQARHIENDVTVYTFEEYIIELYHDTPFNNEVITPDEPNWKLRPFVVHTKNDRKIVGYFETLQDCLDAVNTLREV